MDWHERMQAMISSVETNLQPGREFHTPAPVPRHTIVHVDRHHEAPLQHQVYELDNRIRVCYNDIADMKVALEKNSRGHLEGSITTVKEELKREISNVDKQTTDELRVLGHELRCRVADVEQTIKEERRKRDDQKKYLRTRDEQHHEAYDQFRDVTTRLSSRIELLEAEVRNRNRDLTKADDDRFEDMRNEVRYQGERMEEAKRQMGLRMDKIADVVHQEVLGMTDIVRGMVKEVWKEHVTVVYSKINESLDNFNAVLNRQATNFKELDTYARGNQSFIEAEISKINDTLRSMQQKFVKADREFTRYNELLDSHKAQFKILQPLPDDVSRLQLDAKRLNEAVPQLEAALRRHTVITEVVKDMPEKNEELRWELKKVNEAFARQEEIVSDVTKRMKGAEATVADMRGVTAEMKAAMASDQSTLGKNTKKLLNTITKVSELEEEDGRKAAAIERLKHQIQEHQSSLRTLLPQVTNINCQVEATKHQLDPRVASLETQLQEMWGQFRELQVKISSLNVPRYPDRSPGTALQVSQPSDQWRDDDKRTHTGPALMLSDISHSPGGDTSRDDDKMIFRIEESTDASDGKAARREQEEQERREKEERERKERERLLEKQIQLEREKEKERERERQQMLEMERENERRREQERQQELEKEREQEREREREMAKERARQFELERERQLEWEREQERENERERERELEKERKRQLELVKEREREMQREQERREREEREREEVERAREKEREKERERETMLAKEREIEREREEAQRQELERKKEEQKEEDPSDLVASFDIDTEEKEDKHSTKMSDEKVVSFEEPKDKKSTSEESTVITLSTGVTSASSKRSKYSKRTSSKRSSARSSEFRLDAQVESAFPTFPTAANPGDRLKNRPGSILQSATSGSELERPVIRSTNLVIETSPENTETEAKSGEPEPRSPQDEEDIACSRSSKSRGKSTDKSDISLPE